MDEKRFSWTAKLVKRLLQLRLEKDWLFRKMKQPWRQFYKILRENDFPPEMTINHVRKKWSYMYDTYKIAKKAKNRNWKHYKMFEKIFATTKVLDKYESWSYEWRLKLVTCILETKSLNMSFNDMWRTVEKAMRCQDMPIDCCIQDMKGLWHHIRMTFHRKYRMAFHQRHRLEYKRKNRLRIKKCVNVTDWPLYPTMLEYYKKCDPQYLTRLESETAAEFLTRERKSSNNYLKNRVVEVKKEEDEFHWSKDITETFIQLRLQNDWLFRERKWAWNDLLAIMTEEYEFPKTLTGRDICRKWASTFSEYQKAKATNNKSWVYHTLFELYLGEGSYSLNPIVGWQEEWISNLISARVDLGQLFRLYFKDQRFAWREVEKKLRTMGLPQDHSLLDLPEIWTHLLKTFRWKKKFSDKGILTEQWPYFEAMAQYEETRLRPPPVKKQKQEREYYDDHHNDDDFEDDMKLLDLKQMLDVEVRPKFEYLDANQCRSCSSEEGCVSIFEQSDANGLNLADKLKLVGGIEVEPCDNLPSQICFNCVRELDNAYKFRRRCQEVDKDYRNRAYPTNVKIERMDTHNNEINDTKDVPDRTDTDDMDHFDDVDLHNEREPLKRLVKKESKIPKRPTHIRKRKKMRKEKYEYLKICEVCGKHTKNLLSHLDMHSNDRLYSCEVCDKKFKFKSGLIIHKAVHDPTPRKTCEVCGKTFHILAQYRRHFVYHANERKFACETCGKRFNTLDILKVHNRTHTDERPFSCSECGKSFRTAGCVSRHKRIVHRTAKVQAVVQ